MPVAGACVTPSHRNAAAAQPPHSGVATQPHRCCSIHVSMDRGACVTPVRRVAAAAQPLPA
eukprot:10074627-Alexandrium_andersonii.AAC.1